MGVFGAIYHPVGIAMVVQGRDKTGIAIAINGVFGNLGVAAAPLATLLVIEQWGWRAAFLLPGALCIVTGIAYLSFLKLAQVRADTYTVVRTKGSGDNVSVMMITFDNISEVFNASLEVVEN